MNRFSFKKNTSWYVFLFCFLSGPFLQVCRAQELYLRTFGEKTNPAVVFLHGGPGYNAASFEISTADTLSKRGFYVIVYDRRGEGRSQPASATYSFKESFSDLNQVYERAGIQSAMLVGHSFGGILGTLFAEKFPKKVHALALVSAPVNLQASFRTILDSSEALYRKMTMQQIFGIWKCFEKWIPHRWSICRIAFCTHAEWVLCPGKSQQ